MKAGSFSSGAVMARIPSMEVTSERRRIFGSCLWKTKAWTWRRKIEAEAAGPVNEEREFVVGRVARDRAPDEGEVARVVKRGEAHDGRQLDAGERRAHGSNSPDEGEAAVRGGDTRDQWMEGLDLG